MSDKRDDKRVDRDAFEREIGTDLDEETPDKPKGIALHNKILAGLAIGVIAGISVNKLFGGDHPKVAWVVDNITQPVGQLFLRLLLMIVVPLVFASLVVGVAGIGDIRKLGPHDPRDHLAPQARSLEHVRLVDGGELAAP